MQREKAQHWPQFSTAQESSTEARSVSCPLTVEEMIRQVTTATKEASEQGMNRQIVRILLPRDASSADLGTFVESDNREILLVPPDESWQGGIMQLYRAAAPTASEILQRWSVSDAGLPDRITEDRSVDESGVDGVGRLSSADGTIVCYVQPTQEVVNDFILPATPSAEQTVMLLNPQWRQVNDALDTASSGEGMFSGLANFLGGKGGTLKRLAEAGYQPVYTLEGYVCRGANVRLLKVLDSEWTVFCERDSKESFVRVGEASARPTYQEVDAMLQEADIGFKYARDIGLQPKL